MRQSRYKLKMMVLLSVLLTVLVLCSSFAIYFVSARTLRRQTLEQGHNALSQLQVSVETVLDVMNYSLIRTALDPDLSTYAEDYHRLDIAAKEAVYRRLSQLRATNKYIDKLYVYYEHEQLLIDMNAPNPRTVEAALASQYDMLAYAYGRSLEERYSRSFFIYHFEAGEDPAQLVMVMPIGGPMVNIPRSVIVVTLNQAYIREMLSAITLQEDSNVFILDEAGAYLVGKAPPLASLSGDALAHSDRGERTEVLGGETYLITYTTSDNTGWTYVYEVASGRVFSQVNAVTLLLLAIILVTGLFAVLGTRLVAGLLYRPVRDIVDTVALDQDGLEGEAARDEVEEVSRKIKAIISKKHSIEQQLIENQAFLKDNVLQRLIRGQLKDEQDALNKLAYYQIRHLPGAFYGVCVIGVDRPQGDAVREEKEMGSWSLYLHEMIESGFRYGSVQMDYVRSRDNDTVLFVSIAAATADDAAQRMDEQVRAVLRLLSAELKAGITIGVGSLSRNFSDLALSYKQARGACQYRIIVGDSRVIWHTEIKTLEKGEAAYPFKLEKEVFNSLKSGDKAALRAPIDVLFYYFKENVPNEAALKHMLVQLLNDTMQLLLELSVNSATIFGDENEPYKTVLALYTIDNAQAHFLRIFEQIADAIRQKKEDWRQDVSSQVLHYLDEHYAREDISLEKLADEMHYSVSYLQKVFKNATGLSIREYIIGKRIAVAKQLLSSKNIKIVQLAELVGYSNVRSFINIYKKYTGETPGEYKARVRRSGA